MRPRQAVLVLMGLVLAAGGVSAQAVAPGRLLPGAVKNGIELPPATEGTVPLPAGATVVEAAAFGTGESETLYVAGESRNQEEVKDALFRLSALDRDLDDPAAFSKVDVVLYAAASARWRLAQWFLMACADHEVRTPRAFFAVRTDEGARAMPFFLPTEAGRSANVTVTLKRTESEDFTRFVVEDRPIGIDDPGFHAMRERLKEILAVRPDEPVEVNAWAEVPVSDVVRVVGALRAAGVKSITFIGAPPRRVTEPPKQWKLPDEIRSRIVPPPAGTGVESSEGDLPALEVTVAGPRRVPYADGRELDRVQLAQLLWQASRDHRDEKHRPALSLVPVVIYANGAERWWDLKPLLVACADENARVHRVFFAVREDGKDRLLPVWLPVDEAPEGTAWLKVDLVATVDGPTTVKLRGQELGSGAKGLDTLRAALASVREKYPDRTIHGEIAPSGAVPFADVVRAVDELRAADVTAIRFLEP